MPLQKAVGPGLSLVKLRARLKNVVHLHDVEDVCACGAQSLEAVQGLGLRYRVYRV